MTNPRPLSGVILAAGKGTRMKSDLPKCLHAVAGLPMAEHVGRAMRSAGAAPVVVVVGHGAEAMRGGLPEGRYTFAVQAEQRGTGHAVSMAEPALADFDGDVIIAAGDTPLLTGTDLVALVRHHREVGAAVTLASFRIADPTGYGRVVRGGDGGVRGIVEHKDASDAQRAIDEVNSGLYVVDARTLFRLLPGLGSDNAQGEVYLTDIVAAARAEDLAVAALEFKDGTPFLGVNDRWQLAQAAAALRERILRRWAAEGVTIEDPSSTFIDADATIGPDTAIRPFTVIEGACRIGAGCVIGPSSHLRDAVVGDESVVRQSVVERATLAARTKVGPFAHLRPGADLGEGVRVGNFVEVKNATLGEGTAVSHLTYIGDAEIGAGTNVGAGTITCNYDGVAKHRTTIGAGCFIGSNSTLVAPLRIGDGAFVGAGSVVTRDVAADALALSRAPQLEKEGWAERWRKRRKDGC